MGLWVEVKGKITIKKHSGISVTKLIQDHFDEITELNISQSSSLSTGGIHVYFEFTFSGEGSQAAKCIEQFISKIKEADKLSKVVCEALIFFG